MLRYRTAEGDTVDAIAWRHYGRESAALAILEANPRLADHGPVLPAGLSIVLPELPEAAPEATIRLWD